MLKITKLLLVFLFVTLISGFSLLLSGIKIDSFSFGNINISQFYIKLDKKLIVNIDNIEITSQKSQVNNSLDDLKKNIELLPKVLNLFKKIHIERLKIDGNEFTILLNEKEIYLDNKLLNISSDLKFLSNQVIFDLHSLYLKDVGLLLDGKIKIDYFNEKLDHFGNFYFDDLEGELKLEANSEVLKFYVNSKEFKSLKFLKNFFRLDEVAEEWMYDNVEGGITLKDFYGEVDLVNKTIVEKSLQGNATIDKAKIRFHKKVDTVNTEKLDIKFDKGNLYFDLVKPTFNGVEMDGSSVVINNLASQEHGEVVVGIKAKTRLDKNIHSILKAYDINIPLIQKSGITDASLILKFPYIASKSMTTKGVFLVKDANVDINNTFEFYSKNANVILEGPIVKVINSDFKHKKMIDANVSIDIDTRTLKAKGNTLINSFLIETKKDEIIHIKNKKTKIALDFNKETKIDLADLNTNIKISDLVYVDINKLSSIYNHSKLLKDLSVKDGNLSLKIKDENNINFNANVKGLEFPIFKDDKKVDTLDLIGEIKDDNTYIHTKENDVNIHVNKDKVSLFLKDYLIDTNTSGEEKDKALPDLYVKGKNLELKVNETIYTLEDLEATIKSNIINFKSNVNNLDIPLIKDSKAVRKLALKGIVENDDVFIETLDSKLKLKYVGSDRIDVFVKGYDLLVNLDDENKSKLKEISVTAKDSTIILNNEYDIISREYQLRVNDRQKYFHLTHDKTDITYQEKADGKIAIVGKNVSDVFINSIFKKEILKGGNIKLGANGNEDKLNGRVDLSKVKIKDLAVINNLIIFINSSPALINPFLAVPSVVGMASKDGFNFNGYEITKGEMHFSHDFMTKLFSISKLKTTGNGIDFDGYGVINTDKMTIDAKLKLIFFKDYAKIVGNIPVFNYVLLGDKKRVSTQVNILGDLNNPKMKTNLTKDAFSVPVNIGKRILESPIKLFEFIKDLGD